MAYNSTIAQDDHCWLQVSSGTGPEECAWVVAQLVEKLSAALKEEGLQFDLIAQVAGRHGGTLYSAMFSIDGAGAMQFCEPWTGTIQWIGKSPFRPNHKRKNWFVSVELFQPVQHPMWSDKEVKVDTFRSSGAGGQHVNKVSSAIRVTHLPTGLVATASEERSQRMNKKLAFVRLSQLMASQQEEREADAQQERWMQHKLLERGNAVKVFEGERFKEK